MQLSRKSREAWKRTSGDRTRLMLLCLKGLPNDSFFGLSIVKIGQGLNQSFCTRDLLKSLPLRVGFCVPSGFELSLHLASPLGFGTVYFLWRCEIGCKVVRCGSCVPLGFAGREVLFLLPCVVFEWDMSCLIWHMPGSKIHRCQVAKWNASC